MQSSRGFTLIELLIVVAIIAILAAIAVPNFLQAQLRARIARVEADLQAIAVAIESYRVDNNDYPIAQGWAFGNELGVLTSPVKYMATNPVDIFKPFDICPRDTDRDGKCAAAGSTLAHPENKHYDMIRFTGQGSALQNLLWWFCFSVGPDHDEEQGYWPPTWNPAYNNQLRNQTFDPSNGLTSSGDIYRFGPGDPRVGFK